MIRMRFTNCSLMASARAESCRLNTLNIMKSLKMLVAVACVLSLLAGSAFPAEKKEKKLTCCEQAATAHKECKHKCCVAAHKEGKSCEKCNPNKEDLKLKKDDKKGDKKADTKAERKAEK
jgi:hypothetical protein